MPATQPAERNQFLPIIVHVQRYEPSGVLDQDSNSSARTSRGRTWRNGGHDGSRAPNRSCSCHFTSTVIGPYLPQDATLHTLVPMTV